MTVSYLSGLYGNYQLSSITYDDKTGTQYEDEDKKTHVTFNDMNELKNVINKNTNAMSDFSLDIYTALSRIHSVDTLITDEEENKLMEKLNIS